MKQIQKRKIAILLSILLVLPNVLGLLPMATLQTEAAYGVLIWNIPSEKKAIEVEEGRGFYIGDYLKYHAKANDDFEYKGFVSLLKASYKSSDTKIATVDKNGYVKTLKPGTTTITISCKGTKTSKKVTVVKKGTFAYVDGAAKLAEAAKKLPSKMPSSITTKTGKKYVKLLSAYDKEGDAADKHINNDKFSGFYCEEIQRGDEVYYYVDNKLIVPEAGRRNPIVYLMGRFLDANPLTATRAAKSIKFSSASASAKKNTMTLKFKNKVTKAHIIAAKYIEEIQCGDEFHASKLPDNQAYLRIEVRKNNKYYVGMAKITQGKKTATVQLFSSTIKDRTNVYKKHKMKKGEKYILSSDWLLGKKVKVK